MAWMGTAWSCLSAGAEATAQALTAPEGRIQALSARLPPKILLDRAWILLAVLPALLLLGPGLTHAVPAWTALPGAFLVILLHAFGRHLPDGSAHTFCFRAFLLLLVPFSFLHAWRSTGRAPPPPIRSPLSLGGHSSDGPSRPLATASPGTAPPRSIRVPAVSSPPARTPFSPRPRVRQPPSMLSPAARDGGRSPTARASSSSPTKRSARSPGDAPAPPESHLLPHPRPSGTGSGAPPMTMPLADLADAPLHALHPDGPRPRALLLDPKTGVSLRLVFRHGRIDLLALAPSPLRRAAIHHDAVWSAAQAGAVLAPNWTRIGDLPDAEPAPPRDAPLELLRDRLRHALDQAVGASARRRADALGHAARAWIRRQGLPDARSVIRGPDGALLSLVPEGRVPLPGARAFDRALAPLRTSAPGHPVVPIVRLDLPAQPPPSAHAVLDLFAQADALLAEAGMDPSDRTLYAP